MQEIWGAVLERSGAQPPYGTSRPINVRQLMLADPGPTELRVRIEAAGVCHSDLSVVNGVRPRPLPMVLGHEAAGIVEEHGTDVEGVQVGDRVVMTFLPRCGKCANCATNGRLGCSRGGESNSKGELLTGGVRLRDGETPVLHHLGVSGFATAAIVDYRSVVKVDADVPPVIAALLGCAALTGGGAVLNVARPSSGQSTAVVGLGGVGMAALMTALALGEGPVYGVDGVESKLNLARELGAIPVRLEETAALEADVVIEAAGNTRAFETAVRMTAPGGTTVSVGLAAPSATASIAPLTLVTEGRTIRGSYLGSAVPARDVPLLADMWRAGALPLERLVSGTIALHHINEAMDELEASRALRQMILMEPMA